MTLNIVFLDGYTLNPGDLTWEAFEPYGQFTVYDRTEPADVVSRASDADVLIVNKTRLPEHIIAALPRLRLILEAAAGYDGIDTAAARARGIAVCNTPGYASKAVAQMAVSLLLEHTNRVGEYAALSKAGEWSRSQDFCVLRAPLKELSGMKAAIVGFGSIGSELAAMLLPFGVSLAAVTSKPASALPSYVEKLSSIEEAFRTCDIVSLNCPLTSTNKGLVNAQLLSCAKPGLLLINTARGALVDEAAVAEALHASRLGAYLADVMGSEPPSPGNPLFSAPNVFITPHIAWASQQARQRIIDILLANLSAFVAGQPINVVN